MNLLRRLAARIGDGSAQIGWRLARWPWQDKDWRQRAGRLAWMAAGTWALWTTSGRYPRLTAGLIAWWLIAAYRAAGTDTHPDTGPGIAIGTHTTEQLRDALIDTVRELADGGQGVHLDTVLAAWQDTGMIHPGRSLSEFRAFVEGLGIPVRSSLKVAGRVRIGVHLDDLPPAAPTPPPHVPDNTPVAE